MADFVCWVCRRATNQTLPVTKEFGWGKCVLCKKTREQREPPARAKLQPLSKREQEKAIKALKRAQESA